MFSSQCEQILLVILISVRKETITLRIYHDWYVYCELVGKYINIWNEKNKQKKNKKQNKQKKSNIITNMKAKQ